MLMVILYRRLPTSSSTSTRTRYTIVEMNEFAASFFDTNVAPDTKFGDIWDDFDKTSARLVDLEEGMAKQWYHDRIVLLGDSAHKMTSVSGLGVNVGFHSAASRQ